jgi:flagellar hook-associated protein 1 FlgK
MSSFSGLHIGLSSLYASRRALELTGQNISNVNTEGYSRQRVDLQSAAARSSLRCTRRTTASATASWWPASTACANLFLEARGAHRAREGRKPRR